jgi:hypothetical protein
MRKLILLLGFIILSLSSCKTSPLNQKIDKKREGLWIEKYLQDSTHFNSIGKYKNDDPIQKCKYYQNSKLIKRKSTSKAAVLLAFTIKMGTSNLRGKQF